MRQKERRVAGVADHAVMRAASPRPSITSSRCSSSPTVFSELCSRLLVATSSIAGRRRRAAGRRPLPSVNPGAAPGPDAVRGSARIGLSSSGRSSPHLRHVQDRMTMAGLSARMRAGLGLAHFATRSQRQVRDLLIARVQHERVGGELQPMIRPIGRGNSCAVTSPPQHWPSRSY